MDEAVSLGYEGRDNNDWAEVMRHIGKRIGIVFELGVVVGLYDVVVFGLG